MVFPTIGEDAPILGRDVVILGSGFSKAVYDGFPTTDELGETVRQHLSLSDQTRLPPGPFRHGRFEEWLSYLAEPQPHLSVDQDFEAKALLYRVTNAMRDVLSAIQVEALGSTAPDWLYQLLAVLHRRRAAVVTLNYDNLLECGLMAGLLTVPGQIVHFVDEDDVLDGLPPIAQALEPKSDVLFLDEFGGTEPTYMRGAVETFRLLKLHGSLSWYWVPGDSSGLTLQRWQLPGTFGAPVDDDLALRTRALPRRQPFIVPPTALKSQHLINPVISELWHQASKALTGTTKVALLGYSLPLADRSFCEMMAAAVRGHDVKFEVVNPNASEVMAHLEHLGIEQEQITAHSGPECVARWVEGQVAHLAETTVAEFDAAGFDGQELIGVSGLMTLKDSLHVDSGDLVLSEAPVGTVVPKPPRVADILEQLPGSKRLALDVGDRRIPVIGFEVFRQPHVAGASLDRVQLMLAGRP
jgi:hypothetical protein